MVNAFDDDDPVLLALRRAARTEGTLDDGVKAFNEALGLKGKRGRPSIGVGGHPVGVSLSDEAHNGLRVLALEMGYVHGGQGNLSAFLEALGRGEHTVK